MHMRRLGKTGIEIAPLVLGGNVFGWTADRDASFAILDAFLAAGFNTIDTADVYNRYAPGLVGGESESLIGEWMESRGCRDRVVIITKGGLAMADGVPAGLGADYLPRACEASLKRLRTDYIDVYLAHFADPGTPIAEAVANFAALKTAGKIRHAGASNHSAAQLAEALALGDTCEVFQPQYNLVERPSYEGEIEALCTANDLGVVTYYALAAGFLTGKYRVPADLVGSRAGVVKKYLDADGLAVLAALDAVAARHGATPAQVALAWQMARPSIAAPIASATSTTQLSEILAAAELVLSPDDLAQLNA
ncbi:MAG: aldo/keto reductase [Sphingomonadales bacterium]|nr:aldo/keto reductase [Sphingomonadales bacterium]